MIHPTHPITRRGFIRSAGITAVASSAGAVSAGASTASQPVVSARTRQRSGKGPNVLVVMSDQHRADYMGCAGHAGLRTPGWDRLAREGVRFSNAYCGFPLCCPSRMSFLTGRRPSEIDCNDNVTQLGSDLPTMAHGFSAAGYETVLAGRMHIIGFDQRHGFSERILPDVPGTAFFNAGSWGQRILGPLRDATGAGVQSLLKSGPGHQAFHTYDATVVDRAIAWMDNWSRQAADGRPPFFMVAGLILPHPPFVALPEDFDAVRSTYSDKDLPDPRVSTLHPLHREMREKKGYARPEVTKEARLRTLRAYAANCRHTDRLIERLLACLDERGLTENTIVVYVSDHGEQMGAHGLWGKNAFYEESMRVPLLMRWPGGLEGNRVIAPCVSLVDLGSTVLRLAGHDPVPRADPEGFAPLLRETRSSGTETAVVIEGVFKGDIPARTVRRGAWRYSCYHDHGEELYDLATDPGEFRNLAGDPAHRQVRDELAAIAAGGWAPAALQAQIRLRNRELPLIRTSIESSDLIEPDRPWHLGRDLNNFVNSG